jgi:integrase
MYRRGSKGIWWERVGGVRKSSGTADKKDAQAYFASLTKQAWEQDRMGLKPPKSWEQAVVRYLTECKGQASYHYKVAVLREWGELLGRPKDIRSITRDRIDALLEPTDEPSPRNSTLNHKTSILHHLLTKACEEWDWIERKPKFRHYPSPEPRNLWLTAAQWQSLSTALPADLRSFCTLALATGLRSSTLTGLKWSQYDASRRLLTVSGRGNKRANPIPLNQTAIAVLEARRRAQTVHLTRVFPEFNDCPIHQRPGAWRKVRQIPGLERVGPHVLRHTFASWLAQAGVEREKRAYLLGHATRDTHDIYTHWGDSLRPAVEVIDKILAGTNVSHEHQQVSDSSR